MNAIQSHYTVTLIDDSNSAPQTIEVEEDEFILDVAEEKGIELPYSCRAGSCFDCLGKVTQGEVEHTSQSLNFLTPEELEAGYVLLCSCMPSTNCTVKTHQSVCYLG
nr:2Fe-2S iron-sulfur cluster-binding protein [Acaryochloris sp. IP29b_bin.137]